MNTVLSRLELAWRIRQGSETRKHRDYLDFVIDGRSLGDLLGAAQSDLIGRLGWGDFRGYDYQFKRQLLLESPSELETGRQLLYVCPECGDVGCGAITVVVEEADDWFVWNQFGWERDWYVEEDEPPVQLSEFEGIGPFRFDKQSYREAITNWPPRP